MSTATTTAAAAVPTTPTLPGLGLRSRRTAAPATKDKTPRFWVAADGVMGRRSEPMTEEQAVSVARMMDANPRFLAAWTQKCPGSSEKHYVCWQVASGKGQEKNDQDFLAGEIAKAIKEKPLYSYVQVKADTWRIRNCNHKTPTSYLLRIVTERGRGRTRVTCDCPRCSAAGIGKHILAFCMDHPEVIPADATDAGEEGSPIPDATPAPPTPLTPPLSAKEKRAQFNADWN